MAMLDSDDPGADDLAGLPHLRSIGLAKSQTDRGSGDASP
jgi:hypothetical protein